MVNSFELGLVTTDRPFTAALDFYFDKTKLAANTTIELSNGNPPASNNAKPIAGSYIFWNHNSDDPAPDYFIYSRGTIQILYLSNNFSFSASASNNLYTSDLKGTLNSVPLVAIKVTGK